VEWDILFRTGLSEIPEIIAILNFAFNYWCKNIYLPENTTVLYPENIDQTG
jgi:hypothetical protein